MTSKLFITICLSTLLAPVSVAAQSESEIRAHITGKTFEARRMGMRMQMTFLEGGKVAMQTPRGAREGSWSLSGSEMCMTTPRGGQQCNQVAINANGALSMGEGQTLTPVQ